MIWSMYQRGPQTACQEQMARTKDRNGESGKVAERRWGRRRGEQGRGRAVNRFQICFEGRANRIS